MPVSGIHADMVAAEVHSDDHRLKADFDAAPYLSNATPYDIAKLICCDWGETILLTMSLRHQTTRT